MRILKPELVSGCRGYLVSLGTNSVTVGEPLQGHFASLGIVGFLGGSPRANLLTIFIQRVLEET